MVSKRKPRSKHKHKTDDRDGKKGRDQDTIRQLNAALYANPVRLALIWYSDIFVSNGLRSRAVIRRNFCQGCVGSEVPSFGADRQSCTQKAGCSERTRQQRGDCRFELQE
jgi:hypothetical protein